MRCRKLDKIRLERTQPSFAAAGIGGLYRAARREDAMAMPDVARASGVGCVDTAPITDRVSERRLRVSLRGKPRSSFVISSKAGELLTPVEHDRVPDHGFVLLPFAVQYDYSYDGIMRSDEFSLVRLGLNAIDIRYVHDLEACTLRGRRLSPPSLNLSKQGSEQEQWPAAGIGVVKRSAIALPGSSAVWRRPWFASRLSNQRASASKGS